MKTRCLHNVIYKHSYGMAFVLLLSLLLSLGGCGVAVPTDEPLPKVEEYFPIIANARYRYEGEGNEFASYHVWIDFIADDKVQRLVDNGGSVLGEVISIENGALRRQVTKQPMIGRENLLGSHVVALGEEEILLMEPIAQGTTWTLPSGDTRTIANVSVSLTTTLDTYDTIEVVTTSNDTIMKQYYAKEIGLVRTVYEQLEDDISSTLVSIDRSTSYQQPVIYFFPHQDGNGLFAISRTIDFKTNDATFPAIEDGYRSLIQESMSSVLSANTHITNITRINAQRVSVDISEVYYEELSAGAQYETLIVQAFVNTIGQYYQVEEVVLLVGGMPYQSGHLSMQEGEAFVVDVTGVNYEY